jgi:hypothetical protein
MRTLIRTLLATLVVLGPLALGGCASSGSAGAGAAPVDPSAPVELEGARYKLVASGGSLDGRVVEFIKGGDTIRGCLVTFGMRLRKVTGLDLGIPIFQAKQSKTNPNEYEGMYKNIGPDGSMADKEVQISFLGGAPGGSLTWNLESATWERQEEVNQMTEDEKKKCRGK